MVSPAYFKLPREKEATRLFASLYRRSNDRESRESRRIYTTLPIVTNHATTVVYPYTGSCTRF